MIGLQDILLKVITALHIIYILFVVITPFTNSNYFLLLHSITIPFMMMHWVCNDNTCVLTLIERKIREKIGKGKEEESKLEGGKQESKLEESKLEGKLEGSKQESKLEGSKQEIKKDEDCFTCKLIEPVYDFKKNYAKFTIFIYIITISLWLISIGKLGYKYKSGQIKDYREIFLI